MDFDVPFAILQRIQLGKNTMLQNKTLQKKIVERLMQMYAQQAMETYTPVANVVMTYKAGPNISDESRKILGDLKKQKEELEADINKLNRQKKFLETEISKRKAQGEKVEMKMIGVESAEIEADKLIALRKSVLKKRRSDKECTDDNCVIERAVLVNNFVRRMCNGDSLEHCLDQKRRYHQDLQDIIRGLNDIVKK